MINLEIMKIRKKVLTKFNYSTRASNFKPKQIPKVSFKI